MPIEPFKRGEVLSAARMNELAAASGGAVTPGPETIAIPGMAQARRRATVGAATPGTPIIRAQVIGQLIGPLRLQARKVLDNGTVDQTTVLTIYCDLFANPADWQHVTPAIAIGTVVPAYTGTELTTGQKLLYLLWPLVATGEC